MGWLEGYSVLITGGGSGIGRAIVDRFVEEGARVGVLDRVADRVKQLEETYGGNVVGIQGDVTSMADNQRAVDTVVSRFDKLDVFIGNAGVFDMGTGLEQLSPDRISRAFDELFSVNVKGYLLGAKASLEELRKTEGSMIFTLSNASFWPGGGGPIYTAAKHALVGLIQQLALELGPTIRVNGVAPGGTQTDLRGLSALDQAEVSLGSRRQAGETTRRTGMSSEPRQHTGAYVFLASKENSAMTVGSVVDSTNGTLYRRYRAARAG